MKVLVKKMSSLKLLGFELVWKSLTMAVAMLILPVGLAVLDYTLLLNPYVLGVVIAGMLFFGLVGYFFGIRPYLLYKKAPDVYVEVDDEFLYIHSKKEAKIPLKDIDSATVDVDLPFIYQKEFISDMIVQLFSEQYGTVHLELPGHGSFKFKFVSEAEDTGDKLIQFFRKMFKEADLENQEEI